MNLSGIDVGNPERAGSTRAAPGGFDLRAGGEDIWGTGDQFHFAHMKHSGDFDFTVRVAGLGAVNAYTKAGIMARESFDAGAKHFYHLVFPDNRARNNNSGGYEAQYRLAPGGDSKALYPKAGAALPPVFPVIFPEGWLRLTRRGDLFTAWYGTDGKNWVVYGELCMELADSVFLGLAVTSHDGAKAVEAAFRDVSLIY